ncbi:MAG: ribulose-phosphate 3-epimerase [Alphaproteobacteria bacterium]|nr:ribulose-phosphate 3-epimerase [Alphaproteobacteria bacterium]MBP9777003.1 ribulose-phosphate 3-epimerase [Alphaproteobacteria bacterium]
MRSLQISPSLLSADFARLGEEIKAIEPFADMIHIDVMDGHFVPNLSIGAPVIKKLRPWTKLPFDVHLMISPVDPFIKDFAEAGANSLTVHPEASPHIYRTLQAIKAAGCKAGIALNPGTSVEVIKPLLSVVDLILVMTVNPGFSGQEFLVSQLQKIREVRTLINEAKLPILLQVDGGISPLTAPSVIKEGADILVAGQAIFNTKHYQDNIQALRGKID